MSDPSDQHTDETPYRSAEEWLAEKGVKRDRIRVAPRPEDAPGGQPDGRPPVSAREAARIATEAPPPAPEVPDSGAGQATQDLGDQVAEALAYARRSTSQAPKSEGRLAQKLAARDYPRVVIDLTLEKCREQGIVDDEAMAAAFVDERRRKGHAPFRIRVDLGKRGFPDDLVDRLLAPLEEQDPESQALDVATRKAERLRHLEAETAYRRTVAYVARRGYTEGIARKVAREAVYAAREDERTAGH